MDVAPTPPATLHTQDLGGRLKIRVRPRRSVNTIGGYLVALAFFVLLAVAATHTEEWSSYPLEAQLIAVGIWLVVAGSQALLLAWHVLGKHEAATTTT
jgi:hypothetical protein